MDTFYNNTCSCVATVKEVSQTQDVRQSDGRERKIKTRAGDRPGDICLHL